MRVLWESPTAKRHRPCLSAYHKIPCTVSSQWGTREVSIKATRLIFLVSLGLVALAVTLAIRRGRRSRGGA